MIDDEIQWGTMFCPHCTYVLKFSEEDPDAGFSEILGHVRWKHSGQDQSPQVLWPKIKVVEPS